MVTSTNWSVTLKKSLPSTEVGSLNGLPDSNPAVLMPSTVTVSRSPLPSGSPLRMKAPLMFVKNTFGKPTPVPTRTFPAVAAVGAYTIPNSGEIGVP